MTPDKAVAHLVKSGVIKWAHGREAVRSVIDACVATAKAEAKDTETRRCAARVIQSCKATGDALMIAFGKGMMRDLLTTGGLKVES